MECRKPMTKTITMRIDETLLDEFKNVCGNKFYQDKIRQLMKLYIDDIKNERKVRVLKDRSINTDFLTK